eukprot:CAMPEP_0197726248 /NCGR_PEP_ID=MMETSP1434-20131217/14433_1 /TAXON_ID=265543 /ORGANISM="Minutocellus polymorphus, Strain CCMP3303" /LENGTH=216 /DNA_ID=CAMNT_0043312117 /DNA_START=38 /DNA_END=689 /DNA_ORIENTATION=+
MAINRPHKRGGTPRRRRPAAGDRLLSICSSLGLASTPLASGGDSVASAGGGTGPNHAPSAASQRRQTMVRARRVALNMKGKGTSLVKKARRITKDVKVNLVQKLEQLDRSYNLSQSAVTGAFTSTVMNVLCGSLVLGATSLMVAGVSVAIAERMRNDDGAGGGPEGTSTMQVAQRHTSVRLVDPFWCRVEVSRLQLVSMFIEGKYSGMEWDEITSP